MKKEYLKKLMQNFKYLILGLGICFCLKMYSQTTVNSLSALVPYLDDDNANVILAPGTYSITAGIASFYGGYETIGTSSYYTLFKFSGNNSTYDFTDVKIEIETGVFREFGNVDVYEIRIAGNNNILKNLTLEDIGSVHDNPRRGALSMAIDGQYNLVEGFHVTAKGSLPYGYGDIFGKGSTSLTPLDKHSGILIRGDYNTLKNTTMIHRAFGHCVFMQAANHPTIEGCYIEGEVRTTDNILAEEGTGSIADNLDFMTVWGYKLPPGFMIALCEAGIRSYNAGTTTINGVSYQRGTNDVTIKNTTVKNTRSGCTISQGSGHRHVENVTLIGNENGFAIGNGDVINCYADAAYGPAFNSEGGIEGNVTLIEPENGYYNGTKCIGNSSGGAFTLNSDVASVPSDLSIKLGSYRSFRHQEGSTLLYQLDTIFSGATVYNHSKAAIHLDTGASNCNITTCSPVTDDGFLNSITYWDDCDISTPSCSSGFDAFFTIQAEAFCNQFGVVDETTNVGYIENGDWIKFDDIDFGNGAQSFNVNASSKTNGGNIELRIGSTTGELIGTCTINSTGNWNNYTSESCLINTAITGVHDLYLVFTGGSGYLLNIDSFKFTSSSLGVDDVTDIGAKIFPNPTTSTLNIKLNSEISFAKIDIISLTGQKLISKSINNEGQIDLSNFKSGIYLARITSENKTVTKKIVKH